MEKFIHPTALVETNQIGNGTRVWAFAHVCAGATIGKNCNIGDHCYIESGVVIGDDVTIKNGNMLWEGVTIERSVFVGPGVIFTNDLYPRSPRMRHVEQRYRGRSWLVPTLIKEGASLGAGAVILAGVVIENYAMVGAGGVVTVNVPPYALHTGNPARFKKWVCQCGVPLDFHNGNAKCRECDLNFLLQGERVVLAKDIHV